MFVPWIFRPVPPYGLLSIAKSAEPQTALNMLETSPISFQTDTGKVETIRILPKIKQLVA